MIDKCCYCGTEVFTHNSIDKDLIEYCGHCGRKLHIYTCTSPTCYVNKENIPLPNDYIACPLCGQEIKTNFFGTDT
ncbi:hypothetical protein [uncultured Clostridium sp.]|uniref:hypothetical protein n=1 Tax=uncultured Clostridium sp. TaxID=59620 RepID=UPI003216F786